MITNWVNMFDANPGNTRPRWNPSDPVAGLGFIDGCYPWKAPSHLQRSSWGIPRCLALRDDMQSLTCLLADAEGTDDMTSHLQVLSGWDIFWENTRVLAMSGVMWTEAKDQQCRALEPIIKDTGRKTGTIWASPLRESIYINLISVVLVSCCIWFFVTINSDYLTYMICF